MKMLLMLVVLRLSLDVVGLSCGRFIGGDFFLECDCERWLFGISGLFEVVDDVI